MASKKKRTCPFVGEGLEDLDEPEAQGSINKGRSKNYVIGYVYRNERHKTWFEHGEVRVVMKDGNLVYAQT